MVGPPAQLAEGRGERRPRGRRPPRAGARRPGPGPAGSPARRPGRRPGRPGRGGPRAGRGVSNGRRVGRLSGDQVQLDRPEGVADLAPAGLREPVGAEVAARRRRPRPGPRPTAAPRICSLIGRPGSSLSPSGERIIGATCPSGPRRFAGRPAPYVTNCTGPPPGLPGLARLAARSGSRPPRAVRPAPRPSAARSTSPPTGSPPGSAPGTARRSWKAGPGLGEAGRWSILAARPRRVIESADGPGFRWSGGSLDLESRRATPSTGSRPSPAAIGLADPADDPEPDAPAVPGRPDRLPRLRPRPEARTPPPPGRRPTPGSPRSGSGSTTRSSWSTTAPGSAELWAVDLLDEGPAALRDRWDRWRADLDEPPAAPAAPRPSRRPGPTRPATTTSRPSAGPSTTSRPATSTRPTSRSGSSRPGPGRPARPLPPAQGDQPGPLRRPSWPGTTWPIVGASPELFYRTEGDRIVTRPIKGTRPRSPDPAEDARLAAELAASPKDRAELTMIVDLERNDLGRVCRFGIGPGGRALGRSRASSRSTTSSPRSRGGSGPGSGRST